MLALLVVVICRHFRDTFHYYFWGSLTFLKFFVLIRIGIPCNFVFHII